MIYTIEKANLISELLKRFTTGYAYHVAAQFANIDFWIHEVKESVKTIDEFNKRFENLRDGQQKWVDAHGTVVYDYCPMCGGKCELRDDAPSPPRLPTRAANSELKTARKDLIDSAYYFLLRCYRMKLLDNNTLKIRCDEVGTSIDPSDLEK